MNENSTETHNATSGGKMSEAHYLDDHYEAMKLEYEQMLRSVGIQQGWKVLDAGGGGGSYLRLLTELVGDSGYVVLTDLASENVRHVSTRIDRGEFRCRVETRTANVIELPFPDDTFDAVWCAAVTQYLSDDEVVTAFNEFKRVVRPGGLVAIKEGDLTAWHFGPFPSTVIWRSFIEYMDRPERGVMRAPKFAAMFRALGLKNIVSHTTLVEKHQPLSPVERRFIREALKYMSSLNLQLDISNEDKDWWRALKNVDDPQHILNNEDFYYREPHNVTIGSVPIT